jgi:hypothetical protein
MGHGKETLQFPFGMFLPLKIHWQHLEAQWLVA